MNIDTEIVDWIAIRVTAISYTSDRTGDPEFCVSYFGNDAKIHQAYGKFFRETVESAMVKTKLDAG